METMRIIWILVIACMLAGPALAFLSCGDGDIDKFEQCDDSNAANGDGCSCICQLEGESFKVMLYSTNEPPPSPAIEDLPLVSQITKDGITWTFQSPARVGRFVNGDYYVVGTVVVTGIQPEPTAANGRHGSMLNIQPNKQKSGFDSRISSSRYDSSLRVYPPITLTPGNKLISSRSADSNLPNVMRPGDSSVSPVASISILTSMSSPQPLDAFRPSYAQGSNSIYMSRNMKRDILPRLAPVAHSAPISEFEDYLRRPWVDSVFFNFDAAAEYMASYGRENGYVMSFAGLLLNLNFTQEQKEPLAVYMTQYGIDLYGLVQQGHSGWNAHGGHGTGRKFPIIFAGVMLDEDGMKDVQADFGEDMQTIWVNETLPVGTYTQTWHATPELAAYGGHMGLEGESVNPGWGPYEHLQPSQWIKYQGSYLGEGYRRCCTSVSWVGEALAARLIPSMMAAWNHPQFFAYVDRWMMSPEHPDDLAKLAAVGYDVDGDFMQGQSWKILSGGGYYEPHRTFVDEMWQQYRDFSLPACASLDGQCCSPLVCNGSSQQASDCTCCMGNCIADPCGNALCDSGETCASCPADCAQLHDADSSPCNGCIDVSELSSYIGRWVQGSVILPDMMAAISGWKDGC